MSAEITGGAQSLFYLFRHSSRLTSKYCLRGDELFVLKSLASQIASNFVNQHLALTASIEYNRFLITSIIYAEYQSNRFSLI
jgi:hypothetical protein